MNEEGPIDFPQHAVSSKELRDASVANAKKLNAFNVSQNAINFPLDHGILIFPPTLEGINILNKFQVELAMRKDIFDNLTAFAANTDLMNKLSYEQKRFVDKVSYEQMQKLMPEYDFKISIY